MYAERARVIRSSLFIVRQYVHLGRGKPIRFPQSRGEALNMSSIIVTY